FFSSRRRHTRFSRDWSSDVCSSDLYLLQAQIIGKVTDTKGQPLPYVNIYLQNSYVGTTTNDDGNYSLGISDIKENKITYQFLGYKTLTKTITPASFPHILNVSLEEETTSLD